MEYRRAELSRAERSEHRARGKCANRSFKKKQNPEVHRQERVSRSVPGARADFCSARSYLCSARALRVKPGGPTLNRFLGDGQLLFFFFDLDFLALRSHWRARAAEPVKPTVHVRSACAGHIAALLTHILCKAGRVRQVERGREHVDCGRGSP
ncbi:hypothetical protein SRHO_G00144670 [Serrasalmus rhombeus]